MAVYRLEAKVISRAKGRSATASAAYRSGGMIEDERTGQIFDYSQKRGVLHAEILTPDNTPEWMLDRAQLWNAVERIEKRRDAQLARDFILSLPHELTHEQRVELMRDYLRTEFVARGMIADFAIHAPDRQSDPRNHHAHVMVTMRELTTQGFGLKVRGWNATAQLEEWRERWAEVTNQHLERHGHEARVDHRSLDDQGCDREPEPKQGPVATEMERAGRASHAGNDRRAAWARNRLRVEHSAALLAIEAELSAKEAEHRRQKQHKSEPARDADEEKPLRYRIRPGYAGLDGGLVAQQAEAMRRFARHNKKLEERRMGLQRGKTGQSARRSEAHEPREESYSMTSRYRQMRTEQSKAKSENEERKADAPDKARASHAGERVSQLRWSLDQSMPAQNAAANQWAKENQSRQQERPVRSKVQEPTGRNSGHAAPDRQDQQPDREGRKLRFSEDWKEQTRGKAENEGGRRLKFSEDREGERQRRADLKSEQSKASESRENGQGRKLNFPEDRRGPDLER